MTYTCHECKFRYTTDNMVPHCAACFSALKSQLASVTGETATIKSWAQVQHDADGEVIKRLEALLKQKDEALGRAREALTTVADFFQKAGASPGQVKELRAAIDSLSAREAATESIRDTAKRLCLNVKEDQDAVDRIAPGPFEDDSLPSPSPEREAATEGPKP